MTYHSKNLDFILRYLFENRTKENINFSDIQNALPEITALELENYLEEMEEYVNHTEPCADCRRTRGFFRINHRGILFFESGGFRKNEKRERLKKFFTPAKTITIGIWAIVTTFFTVFFAYQANVIAKDSNKSTSIMENEKRRNDSLVVIINSLRKDKSAAKK